MQIQKPSDLARIVKTQRQAQGLSQQAIADTVGITRQSLARIERGNGGASFDTVIRIFDTLGISLDATPSREHHTIAQGVDAADTAAIAAAAAPAARSRLASSPAALPALQSALIQFADLLQKNNEHTLREIDAARASQAQLNTRIEAGDPDRTPENTTKSSSSHTHQSKASNG